MLRRGTQGYCWYQKFAGLYVGIIVLPYGVICGVRNYDREALMARLSNTSHPQVCIRSGRPRSTLFSCPMHRVSYLPALGRYAPLPIHLCHYPSSRVVYLLQHSSLFKHLED